MRLHKTRLSIGGNKISHFLLVGDKAYRKEAMHPDSPANVLYDDFHPEVKAIISFNDPKEVEAERKVFEYFWDRCEDI